MTKKEAIDLLDNLIGFVEDNHGSDYDEALKIAIGTFRNIEEIREVMSCDADAETKCKMISNILTAKPHYFEKQEPKTGHWIELGCVGNDNYDFECSECHHTDTQSKAVKVNYCWYCGAKMIEPQESEE